MSVKVRFAPSPTGTLHIGGARTALFNWLFARHEKGQFILRIEDTDKERSKEEYTKTILDGMKWIGMDWDDELIYQSKRSELYKKAIRILLADGKAYKCYCTQEELQAKRELAKKEGRDINYDRTCRDLTEQLDKPFTVRVKAPLDGKTVCNDMCRGRIEFENKDLDDLIIARTDGSPTYNLTVVVDDVEMGITHVIRGDDHINNTPRQITIYNALEHDIPVFAHLPMIYGSDKKKLSKRHGATSVIEYKDMGFLPEAMVNYLARLGWSCGDEEIFTTDELVEKFNMESVGSSPSVFDMEKCYWVNGQHIMKKTSEDLANLVKPFLTEIGLNIEDQKYIEKVMNVMKERGRTLKEIAEKSTYFLTEDYPKDEKAYSKWINEESIERVKTFREKLSALTDINEEGISSIFHELMERSGLKMVKIAQPIRVALTGSTASPGIYELIEILGKEKTIERLDRLIEGK